MLASTPSPSPARRPGLAVPLGLAMAAVLLISVNLRPGATSLGPVLQEVSAALGLDGSGAGMLTALPGLCFGVVGFVSVRLGQRAGLSVAIALGMGLTVLGLLTRVWMPNPWLFLALTAVALAGMGIGNVLVPAWIKRHGGPRTVLLMTLYSAFLTVGGSAGALLSAPLASGVADALGQTDGWRWSLALWGLVAVIPLGLWLVVARRTGHDFPPTPPGDGPATLLTHSPAAVALTVLFGVQSMNAYVQFGWIPQIYRDAGLSAGHAGTLLAVIAGLGVIGGLIMPTVIDRSRTLAPWMVGFGTLTLIGYVGLLLAPVSLALLWAIILGLGSFAFPTAIALIPARSRDPHVTARLSGFVQPVGYILAAIGPFVVGLIHAATGTWTAVLIMMACSGVVMTAAGLRVAGRVVVDDELTVS
ncbi:MFS transporter [Micrococcus terreus]|uniref:MFS transporter n=1 Tax=Micrococcus terreus TaxID=574650 RepID=UPI003D7535C5